MTDEDIRKAAKRARASVREDIGKVTGDKRIEAEGAAEKLASQTMFAPARSRTAPRMIRANNVFGTSTRKKDACMMAASAPNSEQEMLSLHADALAVSRRWVAENVVRVATVTREHEHLVDEMVSHERVEIEHVPIGRQVDAVPPVREEGNTTVLPVVEEVVVVQRRLILKEEIRVTRIHGTEHHRESVMLREQDAVIARTEAGPNAVGKTPLPLGTNLSTLAQEQQE
jgi:stress response protein YsnF